MSQVTFTQEGLDELERLATAATQEPWGWGHSGTETVEDAIRFAAEVVEKSYMITDRADLWLVYTGDPDAENGTRLVAYTGNGPTSEANSAYLTAVQPRNVLALIQQLRRALGWPVG